MIVQRSILIVLVVLFAACKTNKKTAPAPVVTESEPAIQLDTINVLSKQAPVKAEYRETAPRTNDLIHTKLEVDFDWTACRMNGKATLQLKPYFYPVNYLFLNARGMDIKKLEVFEVASVKEKKKVAGKLQENTVDVWNRMTSSSFVYANDSLKINLGRTFSLTETYYVVIDYVAKPNELKSVGGSNAITEDKGLYFINPTGENPYKMPQIWTQGETQASSVWFPTIDSPNEKMTQEIFMTVEDKFVTLSNGSLVNSEKKGDGRRTDHWKLDLPHAPYLAMMAVGEFKKVVDEPWNGKEVSYYVDRDYEEYAKDIFGDTKEMIDFYSKKLGVPYAWPKYAQIVAKDYVSGAMENTSATLHGDFMVYQTRREIVDGKKGNPVIAHELFHQWFGDLVTSESWSNLPLNESFATYGEYLWEEYKNGRDAADDHHWQSRQGYMQSDKDDYLIRFSYKDKEDMFDAISYNKGGQVLHMLRKLVGDDAFFAALRNYLETNKFKSVEIHNLRLAFEETYGQDLNWFFNQWFLNKGRPKLKVNVTQNGNSSVLTVEQLQDFSKAPLYRLPLEIDLYVNGKAERKHIEITEQKQTFTLTASGPVQFLNFDAERQLLCELDYSKNGDQYALQYQYAPLFNDRLEALKGLESGISDPSIFKIFTNAAQNDPHPSLRSFALSRLEKVSPERAEELRPILIQIFNTDKNTLTRAKALDVLNKRFGVAADVREMNIKALGEQSYAICGEALEMIGNHDPKLAMQKAKQFEKESGKDILFPVATLYSNHGGDSEIQFFHESAKYFNGFEIMSFCALYAKTAKRCNDASNAIIAAGDLEALSRGSNKFTKFAAMKGIKEIASAWETKEKTLQGKLDQARTSAQSTTDLEKQLLEARETKDILTKLYEKIK